MSPAESCSLLAIPMVWKMRSTVGIKIAVLATVIPATSNGHEVPSKISLVGGILTYNPPTKPHRQARKHGLGDDFKKT